MASPMAGELGSFRGRGKSTACEGGGVGCVVEPVRAVTSEPWWCKYWNHGSGDATPAISPVLQHFPLAPPDAK